MGRVAVVGAGVAGLLAARRLGEAGHRVVVLDRGHRPGGRLASRRVGEAVFDSGAQFFTAKGDRFAAHVEAWRAAGAAEVWFHGAPDPGAGSDGHARFRGAPSMRALAEHLADGLDVRLARPVTSAEVTPDGWRVRTAAREDPGDRREQPADALLCTAPIPHTLRLLDAGDVALGDGLRAELAAVAYEPTIAVLATPRTTPRLGDRGAVRLSDGPVAFITDNQAKGASPVPAVTIHASAALSRRRWHDPDATVAAEVLAAAREHVGDAEAVAVHRWGHATPLPGLGAGTVPARLALVPSPVAFAGDAFSGGRVEGAALSGLAAADLLLEALARPA